MQDDISLGTAGPGEVTNKSTPTLDAIIAAIKTHTEHEGGYCDTGEDMDWSCRSECVDMAVERVRDLFADAARKA